MERVEALQKERGNLQRVVSVPINQERSKFEVSDRRVKGYAIVWGSKNDYNEIVVKGATENSLNARGVDGNGKNKIVLLKQHRQSEPIGVIDVLIEDEYGLYFEADIIKGTIAADEALAEIRQGVLNQLSYGFNYVWDKTEYDEVLGAYILREIKLFEISVVTFSSDENAQLRSFNEFQKNEILKEFTSDEVRNLKRVLSLLEVDQSRDEHSEQTIIIDEPNINKPKFF